MGVYIDELNKKYEDWKKINGVGFQGAEVSMYEYIDTTAEIQKYKCIEDFSYIHYNPYVGGVKSVFKDIIYYGKPLKEYDRYSKDFPNYLFISDLDNNFIGYFNKNYFTLEQ